MVVEGAESLSVPEWMFSVCTKDRQPVACLRDVLKEDCCWNKDVRKRKVLWCDAVIMSCDDGDCRVVPARRGREYKGKTVTRADAGWK